MENRSILARLGLAGALAVGAAGCRKESSDYFYREGKIDGYSAMVEVGITGNGRRITLLAESKYDNARLHAVDHQNDGRFDEILLGDLPKGHPLESYTNLEKLEQAYQEIVEQGQ